MLARLTVIGEANHAISLSAPGHAMHHDRDFFFLWEYWKLSHPYRKIPWEISQNQNEKRETECQTAPIADLKFPGYSSSAPKLPKLTRPARNGPKTKNKTRDNKMPNTLHQEPPLPRHPRYASVPPSELREVVAKAELWLTKTITRPSPVPPTRQLTHLRPSPAYRAGQRRLSLCRPRETSRGTGGVWLRESDQDSELNSRAGCGHRVGYRRQIRITAGLVTVVM